MRRRLFLPEVLKASIQAHLRESIDAAVEGHSSAREDEDTLTGHLGAKLQKFAQVVEVQDDERRGQWRWSITYTKFRGRGPEATEYYLGADGIFELRVEHAGSADQKTLLFQAKMEGEGGAKLAEQCAKLSTWREAAFVLNFGGANFFAISLDDVLAKRGATREAPSIPLSDFLGGPFLDCDVGDLELKYDASRRKLIWRAMNGEVVAVNFAVRHRIRMTVEAPKYGERTLGIDKEISRHDIHKYRMQADDQDVLGLSIGNANQDPKKAQRALARVYHPDSWSQFSDPLRKLMEARMQEINAAFDKVKK